MSCGLCKGSENICLFLMERQEREIREPEELIYQENLRKEPLRRGRDCVTTTLKIL